MGNIVPEGLGKFIGRNGLLGRKGRVEPSPLGPGWGAPNSRNNRATDRRRRLFPCPQKGWATRSAGLGSGLAGGKDFQPSQVGLERLRNAHGPVRLLVVFQD